MRYFDDFGNELQESDIDLTLGFLTTGTIIKVDAEPIDNITKFAWSDDDYEEVYFYHLNPEPSNTPSQEERITELEAMLNALLGVSE